MRRRGRSRATRRRSRGLTVIESFTALAILQVAVVAVSYALVAGQDRAAATGGAMRAVDVAEQLMEMVVALPYEDPDGPSALGPESGEIDPDTFDNTDDYHGYSDVAGDAPGTPGGHTFTRTVTIAASSVTVAGLGVPTDGLTVTVSAQDGAGGSWTITRFVAERRP